MLSVLIEVLYLQQQNIQTQMVCTAHPTLLARHDASCPCRCLESPETKKRRGLCPGVSFFSVYLYFCLLVVAGPADTTACVSADPSKEVAVSTILARAPSER